MRTKGNGISRRDVLKLGAAAAASAALPLVHVRTAGAAGKLSVGFWDHWVPAGNAAMKKQVETWAKKNKVEVTADFITSVGSKNLLTIAAEAQAKTGHDIQARCNQGNQVGQAHGLPIVRPNACCRDCLLQRPVHDGSSTRQDYEERRNDHE